VPSGTFNSMED